MTQETDVAAIARGLTKAQREAVLVLTGKYRLLKEIGCSVQRLTPMMDLWRAKRGIQPPISLVKRDVTDRPRLAYTYALTNLGLAVRAHLAATTGEGRADACEQTVNRVEKAG